MRAGKVCFRGFSCFVALIGFGIAPALAGPLADYGDAPDPSYPSWFDNQGPYHLDTRQEWIGVGRTSSTTIENDSLQINNDSDTATGVWFTLPGGVCDQQWFSTTVSYDPTLSSAEDVRYLNVLVDLDDSGQWDGGPEWPVQNIAFDFTGLPEGVNTMTVVYQLKNMLPPEQLGNATRVTLSTEEVTGFQGDWGELARGETEDWVGVSLGNGVYGGPNGRPPAQKLQDRLRPGLVHVIPPGPQPAPWCEDGHNSNHIVTVEKDNVPGIVDEKIELRWFQTGGDLRLCGHSHMDVAVPAAAPLLTPNGAWKTVYDKAIGLDAGFVGDTLTLKDWHGLIPNDQPGGVSWQVEARVLFDPEGDYYYAVGYDNGGEFVPEPATLGLLAAGALVLLRRRKT